MNYRTIYAQSSYGTERCLTVCTPDGIIGECDPFPNGIPVTKAARIRRIRNSARAIIERHTGRKWVQT